MQFIIHCLRVSYSSSVFENLAENNGRNLLSACISGKTKVLSEIHSTAEEILSKIEYLRLPFNHTGARIYEYLLLCLRLRDLLEKGAKLPKSIRIGVI